MFRFLTALCFVSLLLPVQALELQGLLSKSRDQQAATIEAIAADPSPAAQQILTYLLNGELYYRKSDKLIVRALRTESGFDLFDPLTGESLESVGKRKARKISASNRIRSQIRGALALRQLSAELPEQREEAALALLKKPDASLIPTLEGLLARETDPEVLEAQQLALAAMQLKSAQPEVRLTGVEGLADSLRPEARALLNQLLFTSDDGSFAEPDAAVRDAAQTALEDIEQVIKLNRLAENLYFGLSLGAVLLLAAVGLAITFGVMGVINMAHGEMIMLGAYTTFVIQQWLPDQIGLSILIAIPAAFLVSGLAGVAIERGVIRHLYGRPLETLLATFGISLILQQLVRTVFSPLNQAVKTPDWMAGTFAVNDALSLTWNRLYIILFALAVVAALALFMRRTALGMQIRAVTANRAMASSMGIRTGMVDAMTFGIGSGVAGMAGVALSQLTNVGPNLGQAYIIDSFMVVVFGGVGNLMGTVAGAFLLGVANKLAEPWLGAVLAKIAVLVFIIAFIQKRPRGLFALKGRAAQE